MDYDFITTCNWTSTGTYTLSAYRGSSTDVVTSYTLYYRKKGTSTWNSTTNGQINITSTGEWEVANDWNKSGNDVLTHSYYRISAINSCTNVYFNEDTLGSHCGSYFLNACWYMCYNMVSIPDGFKIPQCITTAGDYFLRDTWASCQKLEAMPEGFILPKDLTSIGFGFLKTTWYSCYALKSMPTGFNLPQGITTLGADFMGGTWMYCSNLTSMPKGFNLPVGATRVGYTQVMLQTWRYCTKLKNMPEGFNIPSGITSVGSVFFRNTWADCTSLEAIPIGFSIPSGITSVGANFFTGCWNNCTNLKQDGYTEDLVFEFDADDVFGGSCPIRPQSVTDASKESPVRVPVNRPEPSSEYSWEVTNDWILDDSTLENVFTKQDYENVSEGDDVYVETEGEGNLLNYLFKEYNGGREIQPISVTWVGKAVLPPDNYREIILGVYNRRTSQWEVLDWKYPSEIGENITLTGTITENLEDYYNDKYTVSFWVGQWVGPLM